MSSRRIQTFEHITQAIEHLNAAIKLLLEETSFSQRSAKAVSPTVDTLSTSHADPSDIEPRRATPMSTPTVRPAKSELNPTVHILQAFNRETAIAELRKAWSEAITMENRRRVKETAERLVVSGVLTAEDIKDYL